MFKKSTLIALCALVPFVGLSQGRSSKFIDKLPAKLKVAEHSDFHANSNSVNRGGPIWSEDFGGAVNTPDSVFAMNGAWGKEGLNGQVWKKSTTQSNGCWSANVPLPATTTGTNGFLIFDADSANCVDATQEPPIFNQNALQGAIVSPIIDLSSNPSVVLSFEYATRWCCTGAGLTFTVEVSNDGGATWPALYNVPVPDANDALTSTYEVNISAVAGNSSQARLRYNWDLQSHYYLVIDDVALNVAPDSDIRMNYAYVSHNNTSEEYGRIPAGQLLPQIALGGEVFNFGSTEQTDVKFLAVVKDSDGMVVLADSATEASLAPTDTFLFELLPDVPAFPYGVYTVEYSVVSSGDTVGGPLHGDNNWERNFEITEQTYSIDALGNHDPADEVEDEIGTESFEDASDGLMIFSYYDIFDPTWAIGVEVLFSAASTDNGGFVSVSMHDTIDIMNDPANANVNSPLAESDLVELNGVGSAPVYFAFAQPVEIQSPEAYFAGISLFSDGGTSNIAVLDDATVPQPGYSSMIYIPNDRAYGNGTASAVRFVVTDNVGINEKAETGILFDLTNNPANENLGYTISTEVKSGLSILVHDLKGQLVYQKAINAPYGITKGNLNTSQFANGVYSIQLAGENTSYVKKFVVAH